MARTSETTACRSSVDLAWLRLDTSVSACCVSLAPATLLTGLAPSEPPNEPVYDSPRLTGDVGYDGGRDGGRDDARECGSEPLAYGICGAVAAVVS